MPPFNIVLQLPGQWIDCDGKSLSPSLFFRRLIQHSHSHSPLGPISHLLPSVMSISNRQFYVLHGPCNSPIQKDSVMILPLVDSVDVTAWAESIPDNDPRQLHIEIRQEQMGVQAAEAVKRSGILTWNEEFLLYVCSHTDHQLVDETNFDSVGNGSSTISLSIVKNTPGTVTQCSSIGCVDVVLGALLTKCSDNGCTLKFNFLVYLIL